MNDQFLSPLTSYMLSLAMCLSVFTGMALSQTTSMEKRRHASLEGLTNAVLINGQPTLRILSRDSRFIEVTRETRDKDEALVFYVARLKSFGLGVRPDDEGKLYVSRKEITYIPYFDKNESFTVQRDNIQNLELKKVGQGFDTLNFSTSDEKKRFVLGGTVFVNGMVHTDRRVLKPAIDFLFRAILDFDATLAEFNQLTKDAQHPSKT